MYDDCDSPSTESQQQRSALTKQVDEYIETDTAPIAQNPAKYWQDNQNKYPLLSRLAKDVLGVPSSSAPVERLFSIAGKVYLLPKDVALLMTDLHSLCLLGATKTTYNYFVNVYLYLNHI